MRTSLGNADILFQFLDKNVYVQDTVCVRVFFGESLGFNANMTAESVAQY